MRDGYEHLWRHGHGHLWGHGYEHMWGYGHAWWSAMPYILLSNLFWIALFTALAWILIRLLTTSSLPAQEHQPDILPDHLPTLELPRQRYAHGESDAIIFEEMQEQRETSYRRNHRQRTDLLKDDQPMSWME
jgi:hypothetical protein